MYIHFKKEIKEKIYRFNHLYTATRIMENLKKYRYKFEKKITNQSF